MPLILDGTAGLFGNVTGGDISGNIIGLNGNSIPVTSTGSTTARSLANRFADVVNVKDFGAVGDGVADDTDKIQDAIDAANANGGGTVYIPCGKYSIKSTILAKSNVTIIGDGENSELFQPPDSIVFNGGVSPYQHVQTGFITILVANVDNVEIKNIKFDNSQLNPAKPYPSATGNNWFIAKCINAYVANNIKVTDCNFVCAGQATAFQDVDQFLIKNNHCEQQALDSEPHGDATIDHWRDISNGIIDGNFISGNSKWGILVTANTGYSPSNIKNVQVLGNCVINAGVGIHIMGRDGTLDGVCVSNNIIENSINSLAGIGIYISDSKNVVCSNNVTNKTFSSGIIIGREYLAFEGVGSISGNVLTITSVTRGTVLPGTLNNRVSGSGVAFQQTYVLSQLSGTTGGVGTYQINLPQTVPSTTLYIGGWFAPLYGFENIVCSNNVIANAGYLNSGSSTSLGKSAIQVTQGSQNKCAIIANNTVQGSTHSYCAYFDGDGIQHIGGTYQVGQAFTYTNIGSMIRFGTEGNKGIKWVSYSEDNKRTEIYSTVNADSAYQELQFSNGFTRFNQVSGSGLNTALEITRVNGSQTGIVIYPESNTTTGPIIIAASTAADSDLYLYPKANGKVKFGTRVATADAPISGYIEIKDSSGNIRKLAVIS